MFRKVFLISVLGSASMVCLATDEPILVASMINLVGNASVYEGHRVGTFGFFQWPSLYLTRDHAKYFDHGTAIQIQDRSEEGAMIERCDGRYVQIEAVVVKQEGIFRLANVSRVIDMEAGGDCWVP